MIFFQVVVGSAAALWLMIQARDVLQPFIIALVIWFMLKATSHGYARLLGGLAAGRSGITLLLSVLSFAVLGLVLTAMVAENVISLRAAVPTYEANLDALIARVSVGLGMDPDVGIAELLSEIDFTSMAVGFAGSAAGALSTSIIILFYVIFMFVENGVASRKLAAIYQKDADREEIDALLSKIGAEIERYIGIKLILGFVQAVPTWLVLSVFGVDGAVFWAVLIFFLSFVPTIGTLVGIIFPSLVTLLQFGEIEPFLAVLGILAVVQLLGSNGLEPRLMGKSLNLSPLVIFIAIFVGGAIWGIVGALIVVPVLTMLTIVFARLPRWRPVAILFSADGDLGS